VKINGQIESHLPQPARHRQVVCHASQSGTTLDKEYFVEVRVGMNHRLCQRLDEVCDVGLWILTPQRPNQRRRKNDITDQAQPDQNNSQGSIVASSISMTGMSSLIGYTR
jgi:hypothetical protein